MKDFEVNRHDAYGTDLLMEQATTTLEGGTTNILAHHHPQDPEVTQSANHSGLLGIWPP